MKENTLDKVILNTCKVFCTTALILTGLAFAYGSAKVEEPSEKAVGVAGAVLYFGIVAQTFYCSRRKEEFVPDYQIRGKK